MRHTIHDLERLAFGAVIGGLLATNYQAGAATEGEEKVTCQIRLDEGHPWRPPFGLERIGKSVTAVVEISTDRQPVRQYALTAYRDGQVVSQERLPLAGPSPYRNQVEFTSWPGKPFNRRRSKRRQSRGRTRS